MEGTEDYIRLSQYNRVILKTENLNCLVLNIRSLRVKFKFDQLLKIIDSVNKLDILCLVETWLDASDTKYYNIPG